MTRVLCLTIAVMLALAVSVVVDPPRGFDGRGMVAVLAGIGAVVIAWHHDRARVTK